MSTRPGPALDGLLRRLIETPGDFLAEPRVLGVVPSGGLHVDALVNDVLRWMGGLPAPPATLEMLQKGSHGGAPALSLAAITVWLLHDPWFSGRKDLAGPARNLLVEGFKDRAKVIRPVDCSTDPERREELARYVLHRLGLHPEGETEQMAQDRLKALDSIERAAVARAAMEAEKRARAVREAAAKAAAEAASYYGRE